MIFASQWDFAKLWWRNASFVATLWKKVKVPRNKVCQKIAQCFSTEISSAISLSFSISEASIGCMIRPLGIRRVQISSSKPTMSDYNCDGHKLTKSEIFFRISCHSKTRAPLIFWVYSHSKSLKFLLCADYFGVFKPFNRKCVSHCVGRNKFCW